MITIREAKPADFANVARMHYPVWRRSWSGMLADDLLDVLGSPKRWATETYPHDLSRPGWSMWIAERDGDPLGMTIFGPDALNPDDLQIDALYTAEASQRLGIGGRLLDEAVRADPPGDVILWCAENNVKAREFYEHRNFRLDGRTFVWKPLPGVPVPHVGYRLPRSARLRRR
ncbi:GNAT family N-acetyltransferase [Mycobacterium sp. 663a-19]|uniref:GNAT family N-acetyltransferase n=1 Tax=Mycobacterium sp. 663a-19 TaxID=2986148 RepID=UPI002D1F0703|nr:GNAT family N-acetyltransferase [Mycobacterium sp. 663a-19]MEB3983307.1 GNAT family N-acetyltransferase [Mycobacterium sp. 663a-19]